MAVNLSPIGNDAPFVDASGNPLSGGLLYTYTAGSSTPQTTYTTQAGSVANANPVVLNSNGYPASGGSVVEIWLTAGVEYKFTLKTSAGVTVWDRDDISGINDTTVSQDQWVSGPAPTYVSATSFTLVGDQTATFQVGRRVKTTNTAGTVYSTIITSVFGAATTVTVVNDSGTLDSGLSAVSYGLLSATNLSIPQLGQVVPLTSVAGTNTITASATKAATGYSTGQVFTFVPAGANTGATTININSLGAKNIFVKGVACSGQELSTAVQAIIIYDGTQFNLVNPVAARLTNSLTGDVALNNTGNYFTGPTVAQGSTGSWLATGTVTVVDSAGASEFDVKLWDGTTVIASATAQSRAAGAPLTVSVSGVISSPAGNIRISVRDVTSTNGSILFNQSGESADSTLTVVAI